MKSTQIRSNVFTVLRCTLMFAVLHFSFKAGTTSAARLKSKSKPAKKISVTTLNNLPVISLNTGTEQLCTGVLVTSTSVMTSKDCLKVLKRNLRKGHVVAVLGEERNKVSELISNPTLDVGLVKVRKKFKRAKPTKLYSISRMAFGKDFLASGFAKKADQEIGYLHATYIEANSAIARTVQCFSDAGTPALVRSPTAVVGIPTYGFGECFFDSEANFKVVGSKDVRGLLNRYN